MDSYLFEVLQVAQSGEQGAVGTLIEMFQPLIKKYAKQLNYYCAESDLIIAFIELIYTLNLNKFRNGSDGEVVNYICVSLRNSKIDLYRKEIKNIEEVHGEVEAFVVQQETDFTNINLPWDWTSLFADLSEKQKYAILLKYIAGYSDTEIAERMKITRQAVNRLINRALRKLYENMEDCDVQ